MSKVQKYIEDAVEKTVSEIKTKGVEISNVSIDNAVHVDNGDLTEVLLELAKAQTNIANAIVSVSQSKPAVNQGNAISLNGVGNSPMQFRAIDD